MAKCDKCHIDSDDVGCIGKVDLCLRCWDAFCTTGPSYGSGNWSWTPEYELYAKLNESDMEELANRLLEDWCNGIPND